MTDATEILTALHAQANPAKAAHLMRFFKTGPGQYGEGDVFLGLTVPQTRALVKRFWRNADLPDLAQLLASPWHEARLLALLILVEQFEAAADVAARREIVDFYVEHLPRANNWDLVDLSVYKILGAYYYNDADRSVFRRLSRSKNLWEQRASIVGTMYMVKRGDFALTLELAEYFLPHPHDLMHKACGWLLREVGKKDEAVLCSFLDKHHKRMPRTMLRYALEKLSPAQKQFYMKK